MIETLLYEKLEGSKVKCNICQLYCIIKNGERGLCSTRLNKDGKLYSLIFSEVSAIHVDPIEKKPLYHFMPGSRILSMGSLGCNFRCPGCQNWEISHTAPAEIDGEVLENLHGKLGEGEMFDLPPEQVVATALKTNSEGMCWTYNDPSIWLEYTLACSKLAKEKGLYCCYITNGFASNEHLENIAPYLDAYRVDIKGGTRDAYRKVSGIAKFEGILENTRRAKFDFGLHVELVTNVTPTINDSEDSLRATARWIRDVMGTETPWHITRFYPYLDLSHLPPTPIPTLERAYEIAKAEGLKYVYLGNVPGHEKEDTYCAGCKKLIIKRYGFSVLSNHITDGNCKFCGEKIPGIWSRSSLPSFQNIKASLH